MTGNDREVPDFDAPPVVRQGDRKQRAYVHECGNATVVNGTSLIQLCSPWSSASETMCMKCGPVFLDSVRWEDTGETIADFRKRMRRHIPRGVKICHWLVFPILLAIAAYFFIDPLFPDIGIVRQLIACLVTGFMASSFLVSVTLVSVLAPAIFGYRCYWYK